MGAADIQVNVDATAMSQAGRGALYVQNILTREIYFFNHTEKDATSAANLVVGGNSIRISLLHGL